MTLLKGPGDGIDVPVVTIDVSRRDGLKRSSCPVISALYGGEGAIIPLHSLIQLSDRVAYWSGSAGPQLEQGWPFMSSASNASLVWKVQSFQGV